jgi:hypothetical protein
MEISCSAARLYSILLTCPPLKGYDWGVWLTAQWSVLLAPMPVVPSKLTIPAMPVFEPVQEEAA